MLVSVSLILIVGMFMGWLCQKCRLPSLLGMLATGMVLGPYVLNLLDGSILGISPEPKGLHLLSTRKPRPAVISCDLGAVSVQFLSASSFPVQPEYQ